MTPPKYEQLRERIIEANPEIMELKFGCEILRYKYYPEEIRTRAKERGWGKV